MTDIKEPINTSSDGTFLSMVCENPEKSVVGQKLGGPPSPPGITPCYMMYVPYFIECFSPSNCIRLLIVFAQQSVLNVYCVRPLIYSHSVQNVAHAR